MIREAHESCHVILLQTGHIFVYTGLLNIVQNDDQLAMVLAHEMAHALLNHAVTKPAFIYCIMIICLIYTKCHKKAIPGVIYFSSLFIKKICFLNLYSKAHLAKYKYNIALDNTHTT